MSTPGDNMGSSPAGSDSVEFRSATGDITNSPTGGADSQPDATPARGTHSHNPIITSINDNADIAMSATLRAADAYPEPVTAPGSTDARAQSLTTPARRVSSIFHSDPIDIPARDNGIGHAGTSPVRGTAPDELTPGRPPSTGPRRAVGPAPELLRTPSGGRRGVSPVAHPLIPPRNYVSRGTSTPPVLPTVSSVQVDAFTQTEDEDLFVMTDADNRSASSVLSGGVGDRVVHITSPTDGVSHAVPFPEHTPRSLREWDTSTVRGHRRPRDYEVGTVRGGPRTRGTRGSRGTRQTSLLSGSVITVMPQSPQGSGDENDQHRTVRGPGPASGGDRPHPPMLLPSFVSSSSLGTSSDSSSDLERQPLVPGSLRRSRTYGAIPVQVYPEEIRGSDIGFWHRFTRSEAVLFTMFLCAVMCGFALMAVVMMYLMGSQSKTSRSS